MHKLKTSLIHPDDVLEDSVDIFISYESDDPITLGKYKKLWEKLLGIQYNSHYFLHSNGEYISNDDIIMSHHELLNSPYEVFLTNYEKYNTELSILKRAI